MAADISVAIITIDPASIIRESVRVEHYANLSTGWSKCERTVTLGQHLSDYISRQISNLQTLFFVDTDDKHRPYSC